MAVGSNTSDHHMELFASPTPNVLKVMVALEELGLNYVLREVDVWGGEQFGAGIKLLNPNSKVPILVDKRDAPGNGSVLFESCAILVYLAEKSRSLLPGAGAERYEVLKWLLF